MIGVFLDTTVLIHLAEAGNPGGLQAEALLNSHSRSEVPYYAIHELLSGRIRILCDCHNSLLAASNPAEALTALLSRSPAEGRKRDSRLQVMAEVLRGIFAVNPAGPRDQMKQEAIEALALKTAQLWLKSKTHKMLNRVQPLACFVDGGLTRGASGELRGPSDSFNCLTSERCEAAGYLYDDKAALRKMIDALHPDMLGEPAASKNENQKRRAALKDLLHNGPKKFHKQRCRALGDAYFVGMCPPGSAIATTNTSDFEPLCAALGKSLVQ